MMWNREFWRRAFERAVKTAAQSAVLVLGAGKVNALVVDWQLVAGMSLGGAVLSLVTSLASLSVGPDDDPSLV